MARPVFSRLGSRPACTSEDFPTPDFPTTGTSADAATASMSSRTAFSRPKNSFLSSFPNARSPLYGDVTSADGRSVVGQADPAGLGTFLRSHQHPPVGGRDAVRGMLDDLLEEPR